MSGSSTRTGVRLRVWTPTCAPSTCRHFLDRNADWSANLGSDGEIGGVVRPDSGGMTAHSELTEEPIPVSGSLTVPD
jgi:hypothetical protein